MKVVGTTAKERRRDRRVHVRPISIRLDGKLYTTTDWGLGGFSLEDYDGARRVGDVTPVAVIVNDGSSDIENAAAIEIVRVERSRGILAASFAGLDNATINVLEGWLTGRLGRRLKQA